MNKSDTDRMHAMPLYGMERAATSTLRAKSGTFYHYGLFYARLYTVHYGKLRRIIKPGTNSPMIVTDIILGARRPTKLPRTFGTFLA